MQSGVSRGRGIEEGSIQKTRQTVVVLDWGARSNAALGIFGVKVQHCVHSCCTVFLYFCWGDVLCRFVFQIFNTYLITTRSVQKQQKISDYTLQILLNVHKCVPTYITAFLISCLFAKPANTQYTPTDSTVLCTHTHSTVGCNIQISPHIFDPARLLSTRLIYSLNTSK